MKIVLDLQSLQTELRQRGIGRYSLALAKAMLSQGKGHQFFIVLNHAFTGTVDEVFEEFRNMLPRENILVFQVPSPTAKSNPKNWWRHQTSELIRECYLHELQPDYVHVSHIFMGLVDDAVTSVGNFSDSPTAITLYDLIPYLYPKQYYTNSIEESWYIGQLEYLRKAELIFAISESSRRDAINKLNLPPDRIINISGDTEIQFQKLNLEKESVERIRSKYGINREFVMYTGGIDYRKNIEKLMEAYASLPGKIRINHQLVIVCSILDEQRRHLLLLASRLGLNEGEIIFTGYVSENDLVELYNLCKLFVFPSLYEGFGLPVLEAMRCGAPVIGSNQSSLPELIGMEEALFVPTSTNSISEKMQQALSDDQFRQRLRENGQIQSSKFSWKMSAERALRAMEEMFERRQLEKTQKLVLPSRASKPKLAYLSPLPPQKSGISDYSAELLPELAAYYTIDLINDNKENVAPKLADSFRLYSVAEFQRHAYDYDRILYQIGNSVFHSYMFSLLKRYPGTVVLHDFFLSAILHHMEYTTPGSFMFRRALYRSHGYLSLQDLVIKGREYTMENYPCCLDVLREAQGVIVNSEYALKLKEKFFPVDEHLDMVKISQIRRLPSNINRKASRKALGLPQDAVLVCSFGFIDPTKLNDRLLTAWLNSDLAREPNCHLAFVGTSQGNPYEQSLQHRIDVSGMKKRIVITGFVSPEDYHHYLAAADFAVQLRNHNRGGAERSVLDCMAYGLATVINSHATLAELPGDVVVKLPEQFTDTELSESLERLYRDLSYRQILGNRAADYVLKYSDPGVIARQYCEAIELFTQSHPIATKSRLLSKIVALPPKEMPEEDDLALVAGTIAKNTHSRSRKQMLVDISGLENDEGITGLPRVVTNVLNHLLTTILSGYAVEPIYHSNNSYYYARHFMEKYIGLKMGLDDTPVEISQGDIFLGLHLSFGINGGARDWLLHNAQRGLKIYFVVYDLQPILKPHNFPSDFCPSFQTWLERIARLSDGLICISRNVANELYTWLAQHPVKRLSALRIGYFHLGADMDANLSKQDLTETERAVIKLLNGHDSILMVGTIAHSKHQTQALAAFDELWAEGVDVLLVLVGKKHWTADDVVQLLHKHPESGKRLIWLDDASDDLLLNLYRSTSALLMASDGEGFGLPVVEAARQNLPIIARDLPIFREIAGKGAFYFTGMDGHSLAEALKRWLGLYHQGRHPGPSGVKWLTWEDSTKQLEKVIFESNWISSYDPEEGKWDDETCR